jgi:ribosome biogenesis protein BRX1
MATMVLCTRGASVKIRHIMKDMAKMMPVVEEGKYDMRKQRREIQDVMRINKCDSAMYFESTRRQEALWLAKSGGMSVLLELFSVFTMQECNFPVNFFKGCGHMLMFSKEFDEHEHLRNTKGLIEHTFQSNEPKDRALCFFYLDGMIWVRNYRIGEQLEEIGPRMAMRVRKVFGECFGGQVLYRAPGAEEQPE